MTRSPAKAPLRLPFGFDTQYTSSDTGLIYMRSRVYDPATAQFLSVDPAVPVTRAPYNYAQDNPLNREDPTGLSAEGLGENGGPVHLAVLRSAPRRRRRRAGSW
jgi:RHS repeat-associated protein